MPNVKGYLIKILKDDEKLAPQIRSKGRDNERTIVRCQILYEKTQEFAKFYCRSILGGVCLHGTSDFKLGMRMAHIKVTR